MTEPVTGSDWSPDELGLVVADYFTMLNAELTGKPYSKTEHRNALMRLISRSKGSIEFKHQNISAVLQELGLPWISGYKPRSNYQAALLATLEAQLDSHVLIEAPVAVPDADLDGDLVAPPGPAVPSMISSPLRRLIRKFDPAARDARNRKLGKAGEEFVLGLERRHLVKLGCGGLADRVRWLSEIDGDGAGFDILSFTPNGEEKLLEVNGNRGAGKPSPSASERARSASTE